MNKNRVVISGLGILSSIGTEVSEFLSSLKEGKSGIAKIPALEELEFGCQIGGTFEIEKASFFSYIDKFLLNDASKVVKYAVVAGLEAWTNAKLPIYEYLDNKPYYDTGVVIGSAIGTIDMYEDKILPNVHNKTIRKLRSTTVEYSMLSAPSAILSGILGLGNWIGFNSSACSTGAEAILLGYQHIKNGNAKRMLVGGVDIFTPAGWAGFDAMRVTTHKHNETPLLASRPMSASASGFVPAEGCGMMVLENYETAVERGAPIYAEIVGGSINSGGQRNGGTITAPSSEGVIRCIKEAIKDAEIDASEIDFISGHLSSTMADVLEIHNWVTALNRKGNDFPFVNSLKSLTGHSIGATGAIETIAAIVQLKNNFLHKSANCEDLHPDIASIISADKIPNKTLNNVSLRYIAKSSFGFGDTNVVLILKNTDYE